MGPDGHPRTVGRRAVGALNDTPVEFKVELRGVRPGTYGKGVDTETP